MNVVETLSTELAAVLSANEQYNTLQPQWKYLLESYLGGEDYRRAGHLTRYQLETPQEYTARLRATPLENHCASVVSVYNSFLFREHPDRDYGSIEGLPELQDFLYDADLDGRSLDAFMKDVSTWASVFGHCWILMVKPNIGAVTRADEVAQGVRPYVSLLTPMVVLDWSWQRSPSGRYELDYFKYLEEANGDIRVVKEWRLDTITTSIIDVKENTLNEVTVEPNGLGKIPAIIAYNGRSVIRGIGVSDINDIADAQRFIYNATSEAMQSIQLDSHPSLVKTPETQAGVGAGAIIHMPDNLDPALKPYVLDFAGANIQNIYQSIEHTIEAIDKMANTGAVRATESRTLSGVAMETEFQLLNARLSEKADNLELAEEQMWKLWCEYMGYSWDGEVEYPGSFNIRDNGKEIEQLKMAKDTATDPRVLEIIDQQLLEFLGEDASMIREPVDPSTIPEKVPFDPHIMIDPATGTEYIARTEEEHLEYAALGYYHKEEV
jgi:hypothetical protein